MNRLQSSGLAVISIALATLIPACDSTASPPAGNSSKVASAADAPATIPAAAPTTSAPPGAGDAGLRGMLSPTSFWDQSFGGAPAGDCSHASAGTFDFQHGWRLPGGVIGCAMNSAAAPWQDRVTSVYMYFDSQVDADNALRAVTDLLPADARQIRSAAAKNREYSQRPEASCLFTVYQSDTLAAAVHQTNPSWPGDPRLISAVLYTGDADLADGALNEYDSRSVHLALVTVVNSNTDQDVSC